MRWTRQRQAQDERRLGVPHLRMAHQGRCPGHLRSRTSDGADDHAARCGPGRRCALFVSPLRAGPSRVVPTPVAGAKGAERLRPTGPQETTGSDFGLPDSSIPTVTNKAYQSPPGRARSKPKKPSRAERLMIRCFRGDQNSCVKLISHTRLRTHSGVRRSARPHY